MANDFAKPCGWRWLAPIPVVAVAATALMAGYASGQNILTSGMQQAANPANVTVIHKNPLGPWPGGNVWISRSGCGSNGALVSEKGLCTLVINPAIGIDV